MKKHILFLVAALALLLSACGGSPVSETAGAPTESAPIIPTESTPVPEAKTPELPEISEPPAADPVYDFDVLQNGFISISESTTTDDILSFVEENSLFYSENEVTIDKTVYYIIAYEEGVTRPKYADSGDYLTISFDRASGNTIQYAQYVNASAYGCSALFYNYGTWYHFRDQNAEDYSGYYSIKGSSFDADGITVKYNNGNEVHTNYFLCGSPEEAVESILEEISG